MPNRASALRAAFQNKTAPTFLMEAHNALSARIVQTFDFDGIWASGLGVASAYGARDANEVTCSEVVDVVERMADMTDKPILMDADSGFGDFNNVRLLSRKVSGYGVAGICIEDKLFPKRNSFVETAQALADIGEFCGKIRAAKDAQRNGDFMVVARTETFITGGTQEQAMERACAYVAAGADAVLVHSKRKDGREILEFGKQWDRRVPLVAVPTTYPTINAETLFAHGYSGIIWANHALRASVKAMHAVCDKISQRKSILHVEDDVSSLAELFKLLKYDELESAEDIYLPKAAR